MYYLFDSVNDPESLNEEDDWEVDDSPQLPN